MKVTRKQTLAYYLQKNRELPVMQRNWIFEVNNGEYIAQFDVQDRDKTKGLIKCRDINVSDPELMKLVFDAETTYVKPIE